MLKEQDPLIELIREWIMTPVDESAGLHLTTLEVFKVIQDMIAEHVDSPSNSRLKKYIPGIKQIFLPLDLVHAAKIYDEKYHFLARKLVPPTFKEIRHVINLATIHAIAEYLKLVTFDADDTIYADGGTIEPNSGMVKIIVGLLQRGIIVSLVTAAGYPGTPERFEERLHGILEALQDLSSAEQSRFLVMGGECNYLLETYKKQKDDGSSVIGLRELDGSLWKDGRGVRWKEEDVQDLLNKGEKSLREMTKLLYMDKDVQVIRKERSVGIINIHPQQKRFPYESLEEICLTAQATLKDCSVPCCAFNGGNDVWVDVGNKALGIQALQKYVFRFLPKALQDEHMTTIQGMECLHVGDRFTRTGNDTRSREAATTVWVSDPKETKYIMSKLISNIDEIRAGGRSRSISSANVAFQQAVDDALKIATRND